MVSNLTIEEFYEAVGGSYASVKELFLTDERIMKYLLKFKTEGSYQKLMDAVASGEPKASFEAAHDLKGISANMGITPVFDLVVVLVEELRAGRMPDNAQEKYQKLLDMRDELKAFV